MAVDLHAQVVHDPLPGELHRVGLDELQGESRNEHADEQQAQSIQPLQVSHRNVAIDGDFQEIGLRQLDERAGDDGRQRHRHLQPVRPQIAQQTTHEPRVVRLAEHFFFVKSGHGSGCRQLLFEQLLAVERRVETIVRHELVVAATLDDSASIEHEDLIGITNGRNAVRDDERRACLHHLPEPAENLFLRVGVHG